MNFYVVAATFRLRNLLYNKKLSSQADLSYEAIPTEVLTQVGFSVGGSLRLPKSGILVQSHSPAKDGKIKKTS